MKKTEMSRRSFLKWSAGAIAGAAFCQLEYPLTVEAASETAIAFKDCPKNCWKMASESNLIQKNWQLLQAYAEDIQNTGLQEKVMGCLKNTAPAFMEAYGQAEKDSVYQELAARGLVDTQKIKAAQLFPPLEAGRKPPQPFYTAPGSGYSSHHPYPGGLVTHTAANVSIALGIYETYRKIFFYDCDHDTVLAAEILHDIAKPWVFQWQTDGCSSQEYTIAGTGAHHIFSIAESIYRGLPAGVVTAQACAHAHPGEETGAKQVAAWLQAASVLAGCDPVSRGLLDTNGCLREPIRSEGFLVHLGDHDYVLSGFAAKKCVDYLRSYAVRKYGMREGDPAQFNAFRNYIGCHLGFMRLYQAIIQDDDKSAANELIASFVV